jgi:hypothetical protein
MPRCCPGADVPHRDAMAIRLRTCSLGRQLRIPLRTPRWAVSTGVQRADRVQTAKHAAVRTQSVPPVGCATCCAMSSPQPRPRASHDGMTRMVGHGFRRIDSVAMIDPLYRWNQRE